MDQFYIVMYHYVREIKDGRYRKLRGLEYQSFKRQIEFFEQNFCVVTMEEVLEAVSGGASLPENALLLTFDDGYIDHYTYVLPTLKAHRMQGSFFIPGKIFVEEALLDVNKVHFILAAADESALLERVFRQMDHYRGREFCYPSNEELYRQYAVANRFDTKETIFIKRMLQTALPERLRNIITSNLFCELVEADEKKFARQLYVNREQIKLMRETGMFIGVHGYDHYWLGNVTEELMRRDIERALDVMDEFIDRDAWVMNYPYGSYNEETIRFIQSRGCELGLTIAVRAANVGSDNRYKYPRLDTNDFPPQSGNYKRWRG